MRSTIIFNLTRPAGSPVRREMLEGRQHLVVPMAVMAEGVHEGSGGPCLYTNEELERATPTLDHKPIVVYHPKMNGQFVSACQPEVLNTQKVGICLNTEHNGKTRAEAWIDEERCRTVDERILNNIEKGIITEVSTGVISDPVKGNVSGQWNGIQFNHKATDIRYDHLAILPDQIGAYSVAKGAGLLRVNEMSFNQIRESLQNALVANLNPKEKYAVWVEDIYTDKVIYCNVESGKLFQIGYTTEGNSVALSGSPSEVVRVTEYRTPDGKVVANARGQLISNLERCYMDKKTRVDALLANKESGWAEADREFLMGLPDDKLEKFAKVKQVEVAPVTTNTQQVQTPPVAPPTTPAPTPTPAPKPMTVNEYLAAAPPQIAALFQSALQTEATIRTDAIKTITTNTANTLTPEQLAQYPTEALKQMAAFAAPPAQTIPVGMGYPFPGGAGQVFAGAAGGMTANQLTVNEEPLIMPALEVPATK